MGKYNQAYYDLSQLEQTPLEKMQELLTSLMKGASTIGNIFTSTNILE